METDFINRNVAIHEIIVGQWIEKIIKNQCTVRDMIASIPAADVVPAPRWISVKERLPEQNQRVLVCGVRGGVQICRYWENRDYGGGLQYMFFTNKQRPITVTHWMPLPEPPKEVKEDGS